MLVKSAVILLTLAVSALANPQTTDSFMSHRRDRRLQRHRFAPPPPTPVQLTVETVIGDQLPKTEFIAKQQQQQITTNRQQTTEQTRTTKEEEVTKKPVVRRRRLNKLIQTVTATPAAATPTAATPTTTPQHSSSNTTPNRRDSRFLSLFTIVEFDNRACLAASGDNGTCMTESECLERGGMVSGPCANSFGVCCLFMATCGQTTNQNCSYFVNPGYPSFYEGSGSCQLTIQKAHPDICQYRLDFDHFVLDGPETMNHICNNDQFLVSGGSPVPAICGVNTGNHMYVDAGLGTSPVTLTVVTSGPVMSRHWKIKVCQIPCSSSYKAEDGCLQYYTGVSGQIKSFNYEPNMGLHLSNQDYSMCIRVERNFCGIQYTQCADEVNNRTHSFTLTGNTLGQNPVSSSVGPNSCNTDYLIIPCASNVGRQTFQGGPGCVDRICGGTLNTEISTMSSTIYSTVKPFRIVFHTNNVEAPNDVGNRGFCLDYVQQPCTNAPNPL